MLVVCSTYSSKALLAWLWYVRYTVQPGLFLMSFPPRLTSRKDMELHSRAVSKAIHSDIMILHSFLLFPRNISVACAEAICIYFVAKTLLLFWPPFLPEHKIARSFREGISSTSDSVSPRSISILLQSKDSELSRQRSVESLVRLISTESCRRITRAQKSVQHTDKWNWVSSVQSDSELSTTRHG